MPFTDKAAFRCHACGHLESAAAAGESAHPHACPVCGAGVSFGDGRRMEELIAAHQGSPGELAAAVQRLLSNPTKTLHADNWEALADAPPERLAELGLTPEQVERHDRAAAEAEGGGQSSASRNRLVEVTAEDGPASQDSAG